MDNIDVTRGAVSIAIYVGETNSSRRNIARRETLCIYFGCKASRQGLVEDLVDRAQAFVSLNSGAAVWFPIRGDSESTRKGYTSWEIVERLYCFVGGYSRSATNLPLRYPWL
jgi:hypothetical protein